ncbi:hypothetical protein COM99_21270 [Bacillus cereus]|uniref:hypothetical protein n=1 Tax=Bacillus cereus TaxID=1396 RepID=UPI000BED3D71|nr:hypothetical protein [Bacillus cereus]PEC31784.1 hypothetical protein COM99_21270 [Bacillus cereus]
MIKKGSIVIEFDSETEEQKFLNWALGPSKSPANTKAKRAMEAVSKIESLNSRQKPAGKVVKGRSIQRPAGIVVKPSSIPKLKEFLNSTAHNESTTAVTRLMKQDSDEPLIKQKIASKRKRSERGRAKDAFSSSLRNKPRNHK